MASHPESMKEGVGGWASWVLLCAGSGQCKSPCGTGWNILWHSLYIIIHFKMLNDSGQVQAFC